MYTHAPALKRPRNINTAKTIRMIFTIGLPDEAAGAAAAGAAGAGRGAVGAGTAGAGAAGAEGSPIVAPQPVQNFIPSGRGVPHFVQN